jgi:membrane protein DedA with SNARE-associated domain
VDPTKWGAPYPLVVAALFVIVMARANGTYWLGRLAAAGTERTRLRKLLHAPGYVRAVRWIDRWGAPAVSVSFLTVGFQTLINLAAGVTRMTMRHYLPAVVVGSVMWAFVYATIGFVGVSAVVALYATSPPLAIGLAVFAAVLLAWWIVSQVRAAHAAAPEDVPAA